MFHSSKSTEDHVLFFISEEVVFILSRLFHLCPWSHFISTSLKPCSINCLLSVCDLLFHLFYPFLSLNPHACFGFLTLKLKQANKYILVLICWLPWALFLFFCPIIKLLNNLHLPFCNLATIPLHFTSTSFL